MARPSTGSSMAAGVRQPHMTRGPASPGRRMRQERLGQEVMPRLDVVLYSDRGSSRMVCPTTADLSGNMVMTWHCWTRLPLAAAQKLARRSVVESQKHIVERDKQ